MIEDLIRDNLALNLDILEPNLLLIEKEYHLKNVIGSKGFIDILAKDVYNNFVIIEIKRSKESSRQTIQEILKYISLLKQNYNAKDSEIRTIIVSTHWEELLTPFSELIYQTTLTVKGIKLYTDPSYFPIATETIQPAPLTFFIRNIIPIYKFDLFRTEEKRTLAIKSLETKCINLGIKDYVLVLMNGTNAKNQNVIYPYSAMFAYQELPINKLLDMLKESDELDMTEDDFDTKEEFKSYLDEIVIAELKTHEHNDDGEAGSPERFESILQNENWKVEAINKYGFYESDPRNDDEALLRELRGLTGNNEVKFLNFCESSNKDRLLEIQDNSLIPVKDNKIWGNHISQIYKYLDSIGKPYRLIVNVFSPVSVLDSIIRIFNNGDLEYLPAYIIYADFTEENNLKIFSGHLVWNGKDVDQLNVFKYLNDDRNSFMTKFIDCIVLGANQNKLLTMLNLAYSNRLTEFESDNIKQESIINVKQNVLTKLTNQAKTMQSWLLANQELGRQLLIMARTQTNDFY